MPKSSVEPCNPVGPIGGQIADVVQIWADSHRRLVELAAQFADSEEWALAGAPTAAHWMGEVADIETSTAGSGSESAVG